MTIDEKIKEAEQRLADLKAEKERLKNDVNISDCWPTLGELLIDYNLWNKYPTCQPITYDFHSEDGIRSAINKIGNENLLFWFRGWEEA